MALRALALLARGFRGQFQDVRTLRTQEPGHTGLILHGRHVPQHGCRELPARREPFSWILGQSLVDSLDERLRQVASVQGDGRHGVREHFDNQVARGPRERPRPRQHLVDHDGQGVLICLAVDRGFGSELLWSHVLRRAEAHVSSCERVLLVERVRFLHDLRDAEVAEIRPPEGIEKDVRGLHIPMHDALRVDVIQCLGNCRKPKMEHGGRVWPRPTIVVSQSTVGQRSARQEPEHNEWHAFMLSHVGNGADVWMIQALKQSDFTVEPLFELRILEKGFFRDLDDDRDAILLVPRPIRDAHPSGP